MLHFPLALEIAGQTIYLHGLLEALGIFSAFRYYVWLRRHGGDTIQTHQRIWILIGATFGAVFGARLVGAMENLPAWHAAPDRLAYFMGNKTLVGGLLGGLAGVELIKRLIGERQRSGDLFVFPLLLGMIIGRGGCFSTGIHEATYGIASSLPWAMDLGDGMRRHPVVLYEMAFLMLLWAGLIKLRHAADLSPGSLFRIFLIAYLLFRFFLDFIKPGWRPLPGITTIQLACLGGLLYYAPYLVNPSRLTATKTPHAS